MIPPLTGTWDDADIIQAIHSTAHNGWPGTPESLLARVAGWPQEEAALELAQEDPTERVHLFEVLLTLHTSPMMRGLFVTPKLLAELTGWTHARVERALEETVRRSRYTMVVRPAPAGELLS